MIQNGIIYIAKTLSIIPIANFINYQSPLLNNPILSLEHNICSALLEDFDILTKISEIKK
jgi:hypothetical protein